jgi:hypothetical protein
MSAIMDNKMTVYEIHLAICIETVDIWNNPEKDWQLAYADELDDYNHILESHALKDTFPSEKEWNKAIKGLTSLLKEGLCIEAIVERAKELAAHPERFDPELNKQQRIAYMERWDKSFIEYHTKGKM